MIGENFTRVYNELKDPDLNYTWFDFHGECKKMKWENISKLVKIGDDKLKGYGFFTATVASTLDSR